MQGGKPSKLSRDLCNIVAQLKSGKTRGAHPRDLTQDEVRSLEQKRDSIRAQMRERAAARLASRVASEVVPQVTSHVTADNDRAIAALTEVGRGFKEEIETAVAAQQQRQQSQTFPPDHAAVHEDLARGNVSPAQLRQLHRAAGLPPPTRLDKHYRSVAETAKYMLAQSLCSAAGRATHEVRAGQIFDYPTLSAWMQATRHQCEIERWQPPVAPSCLAAPVEQPRAKRARRTVAPQPQQRQLGESVIDLLQKKQAGGDDGSCNTSTTAASTDGDRTPTTADGTEAPSFYDGPRPHELGQKVSCIYNSGKRAGARRIVTLLWYQCLAEGYGVHVREEERYEREESDYYLHLMEDVRPLEASSGSADGGVEEITGRASA